jgi:hypothetical protein
MNATFRIYFVINNRRRSTLAFFSRCFRARTGWRDASADSDYQTPRSATALYARISKHTEIHLITQDTVHWITSHRASLNFLSLAPRGPLDGIKKLTVNSRLKCTQTVHVRMMYEPSQGKRKYNQQIN